jgi:hypothetical protein
VFKDVILYFQLEKFNDIYIGEIPGMPSEYGYGMHYAETWGFSY